VSDDQSTYRSGFVAVVGRPNVGKSTLMNALVGSSVATTSAKPQTTRRAIRGIVTTESAQIVLVDTPGVHRPRSLLGERLNEVVYRTWAQVDAVAVCMPADEPFGKGDSFILQKLRDATCPLIALVTKADIAGVEGLTSKLLEVSALEATQGITWAHIIPVSAITGKQVDTVLEVLTSVMPLGELMYPDDQISDDDIEQAIADIVRQAALEELSDELPHSLATMVEEIVPQDPDKPDGVLEVRVNLYVERDSQKGIIIGRRGAMLTHIGSTARPVIADLLGRRVHLALFVKVAKEWQSDPAQLRKLGFDNIG
jgi:GTP-binding protein Era